MEPAWIITDNSITVNYSGQTHTISRSDNLADELILAIKERRLEDIPRLVSAATRIEEFSEGIFKVVDGEILVDGEPITGLLGEKILKFANEGLPYEPLVKFAENLRQNPSFRAVNELFQFLSKNDHPITDDGCFIAYKKVRSDFLDVHSGTFDNSVGSVVEMPRNKVNEDPTQTCSHGLHVANWNYASNFYVGGVMLEVKVNPADVVAVPVDYNQAKMRVCKYVVLGEVDEEHSQATQLRYTSTADHSDNDHSDNDHSDTDPAPPPETGCCGRCKSDEECRDGNCGEGNPDYCNCDNCLNEHDEYPYEDELDDLGYHGRDY